MLSGFDIFVIGALIFAWSVIMYGFYTDVMGMKSPFERHLQKRFFRLMCQNEIHDVDGLVDRLLALPDEAWHLKQDNSMEAVLFENDKYPIHIVFAPYEQPDFQLICRFKNQGCLNVRYQQLFTPASAQVWSLFNETNQTEINTKWTVAFEKLMKTANKLKKAEEIKEEQEAQKRSLNRTDYLLGCEKRLANLLSSKKTAHDISEPFSLVINRFGKSGFQTATFYFENQPFYGAYVEDGFFHENWFDKGSDFKPYADNHKPLIATYIKTEIFQMQSPLHSVPSQTQENTFEAVNRRMRSLLLEKEWLSETEVFLLETTYPNDLASFQSLLNSFGYSASAPQHIAESLNSIDEVLNQISDSIQSRKEQAIIQQKLVIQARET